MPKSRSSPPAGWATGTLDEAATDRYLRTITLDGDMSQMFVVPPE